MATINNSNTRIDFFIHKLPRPLCQAFEILDDCICIGFLGVISCLSWKLAGSNMNALSAAMKIPLAVNYIGILLGCILMIGFYFIHLWVDIQKCKGLDMSSIEAVSYTHLDVYKRQALSSAQATCGFHTV